MRKVSTVKPLHEYRLELEFDDGVHGIVDLSYLVGQGVFSLWLNSGAFEQVLIGPSGELAWTDQIDLCPDSLYLKVTGEKPEELFPALNQEPAPA